MELIQKVCIGENGNGVIANILVQDGGFVGSDGVVYYGGGIIVTLAQDHLVLASGLEKMEMVFWNLSFFKCWGIFKPRLLAFGSMIKF